MSNIDMTNSSRSRFSLLETNHDMPAYIKSEKSPVHSLYPNIEVDEVATPQSDESSGPDPTDATVRTEILISSSKQLDPGSLTEKSVDSKEHSRGLHHDNQDVPRRRPPLIQRRSLLNEPVSFLSTTTSSHVSSNPPSPITKDDVLASLMEARRNDAEEGVSTPFDASAEFGHNQLLDPRSKVARILGADLQALAVEQGGIPVSALSSEQYDQPSASIAQASFSQATLSMVSGEKPRPSSPPVNSSIRLPQPLDAHPSGAKHLLQRSATLPTKSSKRPTFLPTPLEAPKSFASFTRESVLSTPYPGSGFNLQQSVPASSQPRSSDILRPRTKLSAYKIPIILRDARNCISRIGKVELSSASLERNANDIKDDSQLAQDIVKEYRGLRGPKVHFSARTMVGVQIVFKSHTRDFYIPASSQGWIEQGHHFQQPLHSLEEGQAAEYVATQRAASRAASAIASKRYLEESLCLLLRRPPVGKNSHTCSIDIQKLIMEAARPDEGGGPRGTFALEIIEGWNWLRIGIVVACVVICSMTAMVLWVVLGIDGRQVVGSELHPLVRAGSSIIDDNSSYLHAGWNGAGTRVTGGAVLGLLVLLLGWSSVGLWMGLSWLVG